MEGTPFQRILQKRTTKRLFFDLKSELRREQISPVNHQRTLYGSAHFGCDSSAAKGFIAAQLLGLAWLFSRRRRRGKSNDKSVAGTGRRLARFCYTGAREAKCLRGRQRNPANSRWSSVRKFPAIGAAFLMLLMEVLMSMTYSSSSSPVSAEAATYGGFVDALGENRDDRVGDHRSVGRTGPRCWCRFPRSCSAPRC